MKQYPTDNELHPINAIFNCSHIHNRVNNMNDSIIKISSKSIQNDWIEEYLYIMYASECNIECTNILSAIN